MGERAAAPGARPHGGRGNLGDRLWRRPATERPRQVADVAGLEGAVALGAQARRRRSGLTSRHPRGDAGFTPSRRPSSSRDILSRGTSYGEPSTLRRHAGQRRQVMDIAPNTSRSMRDFSVGRRSVAVLASESSLPPAAAVEETSTAAGRRMERTRHDAPGPLSRTRPRPWKPRPSSSDCRASATPRPSPCGRVGAVPR